MMPPCSQASRTSSAGGRGRSGHSSKHTARDGRYLRKPGRRNGLNRTKECYLFTATATHSLFERGPLSFDMRLSPHGAAPGKRFPGICVRRVLYRPVFPLVPALRSTASAAGWPALSAASLPLWRGQTSHVRESPASSSSPSRCGPVSAERPGLASNLPVPARSVHTCQDLSPRRAVRALAITRLYVLPSTQRKRGRPGTKRFRGSMAGYSIPCRRFAAILTDACARLGIDMIC